MRKAFLLSAVAASALFAYGARADINVSGTVNLCTEADPCSIVVRESVVKVKTITIDVDLTLNPTKFAEAWAHFNQRNNNNRACENCAEKTASIVNSIGQGAFFAGNTGITSVNQAAGNNNNQATIISIALDDLGGNPPPPPPEQPPGTPGGFAESSVAGSQHVNNNEIDSISIAFRDALITNSIRGNVGITAVNQAAGNINNQSNAVSVAVSLQNGVALTDAALGQFVYTNLHDEANVSKHAFTSGSIQNNIGLTQVNQSAGNLGNQSNVFSLSATFTPSP